MLLRSRRVAPGLSDVLVTCSTIGRVRLRSSRVLVLFALIACDRGATNVQPLVSDGAQAQGPVGSGPLAASQRDRADRADRAEPASAPKSAVDPAEEQPALVESPPRSPVPLGLTVEATVKLQPKQARTSANLVEGTVGGVAFLGERSELLVGAGNDDRIHVAEIASGRELWASRKLGKDVEAVASCGGEFFAGLTYHNRLLVYRKPFGGRVQVESTSHAGGSEWLAFTDDCQHLVMPEFLGPLYIYARGSGALAAELPSDGYRRFGVSDKRTVYRRGGAGPSMGEARYWEYAWDSSPAQGTSRELPYKVEDDELGLLVQVRPTPWGGLLREYCDRERCRVILDDRDQIVDFAVAGGVWTLSLGSTLALSRGGEYLAWYRDGLPVEVVELATGKRAALPAIPRTMSSTVEFTFDPLDPRRIAVTMYPEPNKVTVYRIGGED